ncbi:MULTISPECIES: phytanoyl-CoA dioxygenase family protein [unclassified Streptomyces]|uniref:Phytanoyl-CoA dioxygenase family protein n=2 Tax=Streptomyces TaxID=1883 RepID=A0ABD5DZY0_9ACTN|nr:MULTISPECIES: phytanoyl-CoA dioxygenase family protein [unclassified Streptomyces]ASY34716.1 phytanoyl-CoA dioxygenase [Streptomyces sp. CLI2509]EFL00092.1 phytanoyl-CoA dioxygenase [Streptomyces sp. SPB78]EGJ77084.1 putative phytanoyl-CoA dioxygenase [Streptomyces sp. Tu6071]MDT0412180.1 phytanoyl-CoA dioxygenase family protein [Streptomyces sp. DSM 41979]MDT0414296.1 phytanoyl-CoA dioxygenase family protein [Streptomyces sp. DSM 41982]
MAELTHVTPDTPLDEVVGILERQGAVIVEEFVDPATLAGLREDLGLGLETAGYSESGYDGKKTKRLSSLFHRSPRHMTEVVLQPQFLGAARRLLQQPTHMWIGKIRMEVTPSVQVSFTQAIRIDPGQGRQPLHRDDAMHLWRHPGPPCRLQLMLALNDFTSANGATLVIPGSHHWDDERAPTYAEAVPAVMPAGSALLWPGGVYHGGGANTTDSPRYSLSVALDLGNLRQEENQYLAVPRETVMTLPEEVQRLLGWDRCPPGLGQVETQDPHLLLERTQEELATRPRGANPLK